jgi:hypothetical protein
MDPVVQRNNNFAAKILQSNLQIAEPLENIIFF